MVLSVAFILVDAVEEVEGDDEVHDNDDRDDCEESIKIRGLIAFDCEVTFHVIRLDDSTACEHVDREEEERRLE